MTEQAVAAPVERVRRRNPALTAVRFTAVLYVFLLVLVGIVVLGVRALLGWQPYLVTSGSMAPTMVPGDVILVEPKVPGNPFDAPTIITFTDPGRGLVTHRVMSAERAPDGEVRYVTQGDANPVPESGTVGHGQVVGSVRYVLRTVGMPLWWARNAHWGPVVAWALLTLLAIWVASGIVRRRPVPPAEPPGPEPAS